MLTYFPPHVPPSAFFTPAPLFMHTTGSLQAEDSAQVEKLISGLLKQWADAEARATEPDVNDIEYHAMVPTRVLKFKAQVKMRGRGRPLPYEVDNAEE